MARTSDRLVLVFHPTAVGVCVPCDNRGGNRPLNAILYRIAVTQGRCYPPAQAYLARRQQEGKTLKEARRCLKRYIARAI